MESTSHLIELLRKQDESALEMLYEQYGKKFYSYCIRRWRLDEDQAWEVVYKTLETLVVKGGGYTFASHKDFESFMFKVLINFLRQWYRRQNASRSNEVVLVDFNEGEQEQSSLLKAMNSVSLRQFLEEDPALENPNLKALSNALEKMDPTDADLLLLRAQNYSYDQISLFLKTDTSHLKVKHHRAKQKLIGLLKEL